MLRVREHEYAHSLPYINIRNNGFYTKLTSVDCFYIYVMIEKDLESIVLLYGKQYTYVYCEFLNYYIDRSLFAFLDMTWINNLKYISSYYIYYILHNNYIE